MTRNTQHFRSAWGNLVLSALLRLAYSIGILISFSWLLCRRFICCILPFLNQHSTLVVLVCILDHGLQCHNRECLVPLLNGIFAPIWLVRTVNLSLKEIINRKGLGATIKTLQLRCMMHYCPLMDRFVTASMLIVCGLHVLAEGLHKSCCSHHKMECFVNIFIYAHVNMI